MYSRHLNVARSFELAHSANPDGRILARLDPNVGARNIHPRGWRLSLTPLLAVVALLLVGCVPEGSRSSSSPAPTPQCSVQVLRVGSITVKPSHGESLVELVLNNAGPDPCAVRTDPEIAFTDLNGASVGAPSLTKNTRTTHIISSGEHAVLSLHIPQKADQLTCLEPSSFDIHIKTGFDADELLIRTPRITLCPDPENAWFSVNGVVGAAAERVREGAHGSSPCTPVARRGTRAVRSPRYRVGDLRISG